MRAALMLMLMFVLMLMLLLCTGCHSVAPISSRSSRATFSVIRAKPYISSEKHTLAARALESSGADATTFAVLSGARAGERITRRTITRDDGTMLIEEVDAHGTDRTTLASSDAGMLMREVDTAREDSRSAFTPGLLWMPQELDSCVSAASTSAMRVTRLSNASPRARGTATRTIRLVGEAEIEVCGQHLDASVVEIVFAATLTLASATRTTELFLVEGQGIMAERWHERVLMLGLVPRESDEIIVRVLSAQTR